MKKIALLGLLFLVFIFGVLCGVKGTFFFIRPEEISTTLWVKDAVNALPTLKKIRKGDIEGAVRLLEIQIDSAIIGASQETEKLSQDHQLLIQKIVAYRQANFWKCGIPQIDSRVQQALEKWGTSQGLAKE